MVSRKIIIQYINQIYNEQLDELDYTNRIQRLKRMGNTVPNVLFDLLKNAEIEKKHFLFNLLGEIGGRRIVPQLKDIITNPNEDDETKLMAAVTASQIDGHFDTWLLENNLSDPQNLGKKVIENMLKNADDPNFIQMFLENFPKMARESQYAALDDLALLRGDRRVINIVGPLIGMVDDELLQDIIPILVNSHDRRAFDYLQQIIKKTNSREIQAMARQAIFKLGRYIQNDTSEPEPDNKFYQAFASTCDGSGSSIYIFSVIDKENRIKFIDFVNNDLQGIKDSFGGVFTRNDFSRFIRKMKVEKGFLTVEVPPTFILEKAKVAEDLTDQAHRTLPVEYLVFRDIFKNFSYQDNEYEKDKQAFDEFKRHLLDEPGDLVEQTKELLNYEDMSKSWFIDYELMSGAIEELHAIEAEAINSYSTNTDMEIEELMIRTARRLFKQEFLKQMVDRLNEYAFLCFIGKKKQRAKLAIITAETLFSFPPERHPFLRAMLDHSFEVHLYDEHISEYDEFDDWDEVDEFDDEDDHFDDETGKDEVGYLLPHMQAQNVFEYKSKPNYPELIDLPEIEKLKSLADKMPDSAFGKFFNPKIMALDLKLKIRHVNYLESVYDIFIEMNAGKFDWKALRKYLKISVPGKFDNRLFQQIENVFLTNMEGHNYDKPSQNIGRRFWAEAIFLSDGNLKPMSKPYSWGAGMEFLVGSLLFDRIPMKILEIDYQVSSFTIRKRMEQLCEILNIKVFPYQGMKIFSLDEDSAF